MKLKELLNESELISKEMFETKLERVLEKAYDYFNTDDIQKATDLLKMFMQKTFGWNYYDVYGFVNFVTAPSVLKKEVLDTYSEVCYDLYSTFEAAKNKGIDLHQPLITISCARGYDSIEIMDYDRAQTLLNDAFLFDVITFSDIKGWMDYAHPKGKKESVKEFKRRMSELRNPTCIAWNSDDHYCLTLFESIH